MPVGQKDGPAPMRFEELGENDVIADYVQCDRPERDLIWTLVVLETEN